MNARRKDDGRPLSDLHICAQAFTFVLAGKRYVVIRMLSCCMHAMQSHPPPKPPTPPHTLSDCGNGKVLNTRP